MTCPAVEQTAATLLPTACGSIQGCHQWRVAQSFGTDPFPLVAALKSTTVQHECIPQAILGMDVLCQAKSGMGKTAVFVLTVLQQLEPEEGKVSAVILCHTRELAFQVCRCRPVLPPPF